MQAGAEVNGLYEGLNGAKRTPLYSAVEVGNDDQVAKLLEFKADCNVVESQTGNSPLHAICKKVTLFGESDEYKRIVCLLLDGGADVNAQNSNDRQTPIQILSSNRQTSVVFAMIKGYCDGQRKPGDGLVIDETTMNPEGSSAGFESRPPGMTQEQHIEYMIAQLVAQNAVVCSSAASCNTQQSTIVAARERDTLCKEIQKIERQGGHESKCLSERREFDQIPSSNAAAKRTHKPGATHANDHRNDGSGHSLNALCGYESGDQDGADRTAGHRDGTDRTVGDWDGTDRTVGDRDGTDRTVGDRDGTDRTVGDRDGADRIASDGKLSNTDAESWVTNADTLLSAMSNLCV